jgi:hypothetical protein
MPDYFFNPDNNIYASWRVDQKKVFSVLFLPNGDTRFVIFKPNDLHPERQTRISGTTTTDMLKAEVAPHGVWDWISVKVRRYLTSTIARLCNPKHI